MFNRKERKGRAQPDGNVGILIDGGAKSEGAKAIVAALAAELERATVMGRTEIAVECIRALRDVGGVNHVSLNNCNVDMGSDQ